MLDQDQPYVIEGQEYEIVRTYDSLEEYEEDLFNLVRNQEYNIVYVLWATTTKVIVALGHDPTVELIKITPIELHITR